MKKLTVELEQCEYAKLQAVAKERGLTPDEAIQLMVITSLNYKYRDLQVEKFRVAYFRRMARGS